MTRHHHPILLAAALLALTLLPGCQAIFAITEKMFPDDRVPPKFKLPEKRKVLVLVDDLERPVSYPPVKIALANRCNELLKEKKLADEIITYDRVLNLQTADKKFNQMAISTIAEKLGADLVIYVNLDEFSLKDDPKETLWHGRLGAKVRVVDAKARPPAPATIWPDEHAGFPVRVTEPPTDNNSDIHGELLAKTLANRLADEVVGLFTEHYVPRNKPPAPADSNEN